MPVTFSWTLKQRQTWDKKTKAKRVRHRNRK